MKLPFLRIRTHYSFLSSTIKIPEYIAFLKERGYSHAPVCDLYSLSSLIELYKRTDKATALKPIVGIEFKSRLSDEKKVSVLLFAKNQEGLEEIYDLSSRYNELDNIKELDLSEIISIENAIIVLTDLTDEHNESIILKDTKEIKEESDLYVGLSNLSGYKGEHLFRGTKIKLILSPLITSLNKEDSQLIPILEAIKDKKKFTQEEFAEIKSSKPKNFFPGKEGIEALNKVCSKELVKNQNELLSKIKLNYEPHKVVFPKIKDLTDAKTSLRKLCFKGLEERGLLSDDYKKRAEYELEVINRLGFNDYFLVVADFIKYSKENNIPVGPGRGSGAGSLVAYALSITEVDPLIHNLIFERFLNPERVSLPDFDIDFCKDKRSQVIKYVSKKYGKNKVAQIITFGQLKGRSSIRDIARVLGLSLDKVNAITKSLPVLSSQSLKEEIQENQSLLEVYEEDPSVKQVVDIAARVEGLYRQAGIHAAGVVISPVEVSKIVPTLTGREKEQITQFDKNDIEDGGLVKFDFLGLKTLTLIKSTLELIEKNRKLKIKLPKETTMDQKSFDLLSKGDTTGIFQVESLGFRDLLMRMKPDKFSDIPTAVALYRPGPMESGILETYMERRSSKASKFEAIDPRLNEVFSETYGLMVYQEQVMQASQKIAGFSMAEADSLRKAMGKKDQELMDKIKEKFLTGAVNNGITKEKAYKIFSQIQEFGKYGFNKSHSVAYSVITYHTAYLKAHYPLEFYAALLSTEMEDNDKLMNYINEIKRLGYEILRPSINKSEKHFTIEDGKIRSGLGAINDLGEAAIKVILKARKAGKFKSIVDFLSRVDLRRINKRVQRRLIYSFTLSEFVANPMALDLLTQAILFEKDNLSRLEKRNLKLKIEVKSSLRQLEKAGFDSLGFYTKKHPCERSKKSNSKDIKTLTQLKEESLHGTRNLSRGEIIELRPIKTKNGDDMAFVEIIDSDNRISAAIFPKNYEKYKDTLYVGSQIGFSSQTNNDPLRGKSFIVENIKKLSFSSPLKGKSAVVIDLGKNRIDREKLESIFKGCADTSFTWKIRQKGGEDSFRAQFTGDILSKIISSLT